MPWHHSRDSWAFNMVGKSKPATKAEKERLSKLHELPCLCCQMMGVEQPNRTTAHHLLSAGRRRGHRYTVNLCEWHHYGRPVVITRYSIEGHTDEWMTEKYGPPLIMGSRAFHAAFGTDDELLAKADAMLETL